MRLELPIVSFVSAFLVLIPLPFHWTKRNVCVISLIVWLAVSNFYRGINTIIWADNVTVKYKIWCDIVAAISVSGNVGVLASAACVCRRLSQACSPYYRAPTWHEKRRRAKFEIGVCVVAPIIYPALHLLVQTHRFAIIEEFGCAPRAYISIPALFVIYAPLISLSWAALVYAGVALRWLIHRRTQLQQTLQHTQPIPPSGRYLQLLAVAVTQMAFATVMTIFVFASTLHYGVEPWTSWKDVHQNWREISVHPKDSYSDTNLIIDIVTWYFVPLASVIVFANFGLDDRVVVGYGRMFTWVKARIFNTRIRVVVMLPLSADDAVTNEGGTDAGEARAKTARTDGITSLNPSWRAFHLNILPSQQG